MTTPITTARTPRIDERAAPFVSQLHRLSTSDQVALKRALGCTLGQAKPAAQAAFFRIAPQTCKPWEENAFFLSACSASAFADAPWRKYDFVACLRTLSEDSEGVERQFLSLLDTPWEEDGYLLGKMSRLLRRILHSEQCVHQAALLSDLLRWNHPARTVQLRWARLFYTGAWQQDDNAPNKAAPSAPQTQNDMTGGS